MIPLHIQANLLAQEGADLIRRYELSGDPGQINIAWFLELMDHVHRSTKNHEKVSKSGTLQGVK